MVKEEEGKGDRKSNEREGKREGKERKRKGKSEEKGERNVKERGKRSRNKRRLIETAKILPVQCGRFSWFL